MTIAIVIQEVDWVVFVLVVISCVIRFESKFPAKGAVLEGGEEGVQIGEGITHDLRLRLASGFCDDLERVRHKCEVTHCYALPRYSFFGEPRYLPDVVLGAA